MALISAWEHAKRGFPHTGGPTLEMARRNQWRNAQTGLICCDYFPRPSNSVAYIYCVYTLGQNVNKDVLGDFAQSTLPIRLHWARVQCSHKWIHRPPSPKHAVGGDSVRDGFDCRVLDDAFSGFNHLSECKCIVWQVIGTHFFTRYILRSMIRLQSLITENSQNIGTK